MEPEMIGPITRLLQCHPTIVNIVASYQLQRMPQHHEIYRKPGKIKVGFQDFW